MLSNEIIRQGLMLTTVLYKHLQYFSYYSQQIFLKSIETELFKDKTRLLVTKSYESNFNHKFFLIFTIHNFSD